MTNAPKTLLVLGAGANLGASLGQVFRAAGYQVALASRSLTPGRDATTGALHIRLDASDAGAVARAFAEVRRAFAAPPAVVVYNAHRAERLERADPLRDVRAEGAAEVFGVNSVGALVAAKEAVKGWREIAEEKGGDKEGFRGTFVFTGNRLNVDPAWPHLLTFGMAKTATAYMIASLRSVYGGNGEGFRFYYADERYADGAPMIDGISGVQGAQEYLALAEAKEYRPWLYTFVGGQGYKNFKEVDDKLFEAIAGTID